MVYAKLYTEAQTECAAKAFNRSNCLQQHFSQLDNRWGISLQSTRPKLKQIVQPGNQQV